MEITPANKDDLPAILTLFDDAVAWLVERGLEGQWGTTPFSELPRMRDRLLEWIDQGTMFVGRIDGSVAGTVVLSDTVPAYARHLFPDFPSSDLYLEAFATARSLAGRGVGRDLLGWAERYALRRAKTTLWLDCWAGNAALCDYYRGMGFTPRQQFNVGEWRGQLFERKL